MYAYLYDFLDAVIHSVSNNVPLQGVL